MSDSNKLKEIQYAISKTGEMYDQAIFVKDFDSARTYDEMGTELFFEWIAQLISEEPDEWEDFDLT